MEQHRIKPGNLQYGDVILLHEQPCSVKYVDGVSGMGAVDVYVTDSAGLPHHEILTEPVIILM